MIRVESVAELITLLNETDEAEDLEAKEASDNVGKSVFETVCALSNEPGLGGGTILLGVLKIEQMLFPMYEAIGIKDPDKMMSDIASSCSSMFNQPVRVNLSTYSSEDNIILRIDVPEVPQNQKPIYFKSKGLPSGAFRRIGPTDVKCTDEDIQIFFQGKANEPYDTRIVHDARWDDIDTTAIAAYRKTRAEANSAAEELNWSDEEMLYALGATQRLDGGVQITATGLLTFGKASSLRRLMPSQRLDYIRVPGKTWVQNPDFTYETLQIRGPILLTVGRILASVLDDLPKTLVVEDSLSGRRTETPVIPNRVIREAVVNALMHRSYETNQPVQIIRYANRLEIRNPGHSLKSPDRLSEPGSAIRNPSIAEILHETLYAENKGSGIRVMQEKMKSSGLASPTFESDREAQQFTATFLFHHFLDESDWKWLAQFSDLQLSEDQVRALIFVREVEAIDNSAYRDLTQVDILAASKSLKHLVKEGLLQMKGGGARTHYIAGPKFTELTNMDGLSITIHDNTSNMDGKESRINLIDVPIAIRIHVRTLHLKKRAKPEEVNAVILKLCDWRALSLAEIAELLDKTPTYISQKFIGKMVSDGQLCYLFPELPQHPNQKYQSPRLHKAG
jgi:ATP-dependent DNA helicase RecG